MSKVSHIIMHVKTNKQIWLYHTIKLQHGIYVGAPWAMSHIGPYINKALVHLLSNRNVNKYVLHRTVNSSVKSEFNFVFSHGGSNLEFQINKNYINLLKDLSNNHVQNISGSINSMISEITYFL